MVRFGLGDYPRKGRAVGLRVKGFRVLWFRVLEFQGLGFRVLWFRVLEFQGLGLRASGVPGFGGLGFRRAQTQDPKHEAA